MNFRGEKRSNTTHQSTTDPDAKLYRKGDAQPAVLGYLGYVLLDNRHGLVANTCVTPATGTAEREAALGLIACLPNRDVTVGADKAYDVASYVETCRGLGATPHVAQKVRGSAIDGRTTRHSGYAISQQKRKLVEQVLRLIRSGGRFSYAA